MSSNEYGEGLGYFDTLVLDEAHDAYDHLSDFVSVRITQEMVDAYLHGVGPPPTDPTHWMEWANIGLFHVERPLRDLLESVAAGDRTAVATARELSRLVKSLGIIRGIQDTKAWILTVDEDKTTWTWQPIWCGRWAESALFQGVKRVIMTSATLREKAMDLLYVPKDNRKMFEYPSSFHKSRRPVFVVKTVRVSNKTTPEEMQVWVDRHDQIIRARLKWKGIVHAGSYKRAKYLVERSQFRDHMMLHTRRNTAEVVQKFKGSFAPAVLVSPSVTTGWDFPGAECRYQIVSKIPFPNMMDPLVEARSKSDKRYAHYSAMTDIVQASGRGMRSAQDWCETFIIDDHFKDWFFRSNRDFAPLWFREAMVISNALPRPLALSAT
jgi:Rad3-related DNA helicase